MNPVFARWSIYSSLLLLTAAASVWVTVNGKGNPAVSPVVTIPRAIAIKVASGTIDQSPLVIPVREFPERALAEQTRDPFSTAIAVEPPKVVQQQQSRPSAAPQPRAVAPSLPFTYRGMLMDSDGTWIVQLARGGNYLLASPGEIIDSTYRLDDMQNNELQFTYLPLSTPQILNAETVRP
jgi:hypothetical protein